jgi:hypothetical protein
LYKSIKPSILSKKTIEKYFRIWSNGRERERERPNPREN